MGDLGNKKIFSKNLRHYMKLNHKDRNNICHDLGFKYSTVTDWINGNIYPRIDKIEMLANYFYVEKSDLIEDHSKKENNTLTNNSFYMCPLYNEILSEKPYWIDANIKGRIILDTNIYKISHEHSYFSIEVNENYTNFRTAYGRYIIFQKQNSAKDDDVILTVIENSKPCIRKYKKLSNTLVMLQPIDSTDVLEPLVIDITNAEMSILGIAIGYFGKMEAKS